MSKPTVINRFVNHSPVFLWNTNIKEAVKQGQPHKSLILFRHMKQNGEKPNNLTFPFLAKACAKLNNLQYSQIIHTHVAKSPHQFDIYVQTALVDMYVKCDRLDYAHQMFDKMPVRDVTSWNVMIVGFSQLGFFDRVLNLLSQMRLDGVCPDAVTVIGLMQLGSSVRDVKFVTGVHCLGIVTGVELDVLVANTLISAYGKCGELSAAEKVFYGIESGCLTVVSCNSLIAGYAYGGQIFKSISLYKFMIYDGFRPDISTILNLLSSCVQLEAVVQQCKLIHCHGIKLGCDTDTAVLNTLISVYSKNGDMSSARDIFDSVIGKTRVTWTAMIGGYAEKGELDEALALFHSMEGAGEKPDLVTALYIISGCGKMGALETGKWIDNYVISNGMKSNLMVSNALIDMYGKCGSIKEARKLFNTMKERSIVSWTTMIAGFALNGEFKEALDHFFLMLESGLTPNGITFLSVLQACNHAGFLEKGWECFDLMTEVYKLNPELDHYSCMADLLGRKGKLKEALDFIRSMPVKPDAGIWGALLSSCKIHRNIEIGQYAADRLFEIEPHAAAPYVEMANIYAYEGRWDGVSAVRTRMKCNQVTKYPGQSVIEVNGKGHTFTVEDRGHPTGLLIYEALDGLALQLKEDLESSCYEGYSFYEE